MSRRASRTPILPLCGSMLANATIMSGVLARRVDDFLVRDAPHAHLELGVDREHHQADLALAVVGHRLGMVLRLSALKYLLAASS
jgi:hypothetical protein